MINSTVQTDIHYLIIADLAIKAVNLHLSKSENLRLTVVFEPLTTLLIKELNNVFYPLKTRLKRQGIEIVKWQTVDSFFSDVILRTTGENLQLRYAKKVLQHDVEQLIIQTLKTAVKKWLDE